MALRRHKVLAMATATLMGILAVNPVPLAAKNLLQMDQKAVAKYQAAKQDYLKLYNSYKQVRPTYLKAEAKFRSAGNGAEETPQFVDEVRAYLLNAADVAVSYLTVLKTEIESTPTLSASAKADILSEVEDDIVWLENQRSTIAEAETLEELRQASRLVKDYWHKVKPRARKLKGRFLILKTAFLIDRLETIVEQVADRAESANDDEVDTAEIDELLDAVGDRIALAKEKAQAAEAQYQSGDSVQESEAAILEAKEIAKDLHQDLKDVSLDLKQAVKELKKALKPGTGVNAEDEGRHEEREGTETEQGKDDNQPGDDDEGQERQDEEEQD